MSFGGSGSGSGSISGSSDVLLSSPSNSQVLTYDEPAAKWKNATAATGASPSYANLPAGTTLTVIKSGATWPTRPTARADIVVQWKGADPSPTIISSGIGGMLDNVDMRFVTP